MYSAIDVARYVVEYCNAHKYSMSNLKLQKILYFIQAYFLIESHNKQPCFYEDIEAWDFGPVVPEVYSEFKQFGSTDIPSMWYAFDFIASNDKKLIRDVIEKFKYYSASDLVKITHGQAPWQDAYNKGYNRVITIEAIRGYFGG